MTDNFNTLLEESFDNVQLFKEGELLKGVIVEINNKTVTISIGGKSEGYIPLEEFNADEIKVGAKLI